MQGNDTRDSAKSQCMSYKHGDSSDWAPYAGEYEILCYFRNILVAIASSVYLNCNRGFESSLHV